MWNTSRLVSLACLLAAGVSAQEKETPRPQDASASQNPALKKVLEAGDEERAKALTSFVEAQIATGATYAGQYVGLAPVKDEIVGLLHKWVIDAPLETKDADEFRVATIRALRDLLGKEAPDDLMETLREIARDEFEPANLKNAAVYALAQFGDRTLIDAIIKQAEAAAKSTDPRQQASAYATLANIHYNLGSYDDAVSAYQKLIALHHDGKIELQALGSTYYNCACSLALGGHPDEAIAYIEKGLEAAKTGRQPLPRSLLATDMDIASVRNDPRFAALMEKYYGEEKDEAKEGGDTPKHEKGGDEGKKGGDKGK